MDSCHGNFTILTPFLRWSTVVDLALVDVRACTPAVPEAASVRGDGCLGRSHDRRDCAEAVERRARRVGTCLLADGQAHEHSSSTCATHVHMLATVTLSEVW